MDKTYKNKNYCVNIVAKSNICLGSMKNRKQLSYMFATTIISYSKHQVLTFVIGLDIFYLALIFLN